MAEFFLPLCLLVFSLSFYLENTNRSIALSRCWIFVLTLGAVLRIVLHVTPHFAPYLGVANFLGFGVWGAIRLRKKCTMSLSSWDWPLTVLVIYVLGRSFFPNIDSDSFNYHLPAIQWLWDRPLLPALQRLYESQEARYFWAGSESFLAIPGLLFHLPLFAGVLGGVIKILSVLSVLTLLPKKARCIRYIASFLLLVDDHFFFSGQNKFVYLNPSLVGVFALIAYLTLRGIRGHSFSLKESLLLCACALPIKYQVVYVFLPVTAVGFFCLVRRRIRITRCDATLIALATLNVFSVYGLNLFETGTPLYPFPLGPFKAHLPYIGYHLGYYSETTQLSWLGTLAKYHYKIFTLSGNLAAKVAFVLFPFGIGAWFFRKRHRPVLEYGLWLIGIHLVWNLVIARYFPIDLEEGGRYARYFFGSAVVGILCLALSLRWRKGIKLTSKGTALWGAVICFYLVLSTDSRTTNLNPNVRPTWAEIWYLMTTPSARGVEMVSPQFQKYFFDYVVRDYERFSKCLNPQQLIRGDRLAFYKLGAASPNHPYGRDAYRLGKYGGSLLPLEEDLAKKAPEIEYAIFPKNTLDALRSFVSPKLKERLERAQVLCETERSLLVKLHP